MALLLLGCSPAPPPQQHAKGPAPVSDESRQMPLENRVSAGVVEDHVLGKQWLPGGTVGHYKKGKQEWDLFLVQAGPTNAPLRLLDYKREMVNAKLVPSFGGYSGSDGGKPAFVFTKGPWLAGIIGLPQADADRVARDFAARIH